MSEGSLENARTDESPASGLPEQPTTKLKATTVQPDPLQVRDIRAQEAMASWAEAMFWMTAASLIVALAALLALITQIKHGTRTTERQLRAYLAVRPLGVLKVIGSSHVVGQVVLRNVGSTFAQNVSLEVNARMVADQTSSEFPVVADPVHVPRTLQPGDEMTQGSNKLLLGDIQSPTNTIFLWGIARYDDGFGKRRSTRFCHRYPCASHDRDAYQRSSAKGVRETVRIIGPDKMRLNETGNDAD